jgi:predicted nucleic-acid-binding Zn-ribbon protein
MSKNYQCPKCASNEFETGQIRVSGGNWSRIFDMANKKYTAVTCKKCKYTEFYKGTASALGNILDFFTG